MKISELPWTSRFVEQMPGDPELRNFVRVVPGAAYSAVAPTAVRSPTLLGWSPRLAESLGLDRPDPESAELALLSGNKLLPGMRPYSARYGGHQFGHWARQLGDGRAITLGEAQSGTYGNQEYQLKGAGPTPYSRTADGRAVLRSSVREFLCSEALHFLGIPTTRALSLVGTGEAVVRDPFYDGNPAEEPGAIVCRVAPSFLRFGNFEILARSGEKELLKQLADFLIAEHYPSIAPGSADAYGLLLDEIARRTAETIAHWMRVGFVHGVMNTDNMSALGLTIDYGPYGWLEPFDPNWTPNTTDASTHRYAFGQQPGVGLWNLARLCEAFMPLIPDEQRLQQSLAVYQESYGVAYGAMLAAKFGLTRIENQDDSLIETAFANLEFAETDFVLFFRALSNWSPDQDFLTTIAPAFYSEPPPALRDKWQAWSRLYGGRLEQDGRNASERGDLMKKTNPKYVLRNYLAQGAIQAAARGDLGVIERLLRVLERPYDDQPGEEDLAEKRPEWARSAPGCSALSCSS